MTDDWKTETVEACLQRISLPRVKLPTSAYKRSGKHPIIDQSQADIAGWTDDEDGLIDEQLPVIVFGDHSRTLKYVDMPFVRGADGTQILKPRLGIDPLFFFYALRSLNLESRGYNRHFTLLKEQLVPMPEQSEQVRIAHALKQLEDGIRLQVRQAAAVEELKDVTLHEVFARGVRGEPQKGTEIGPMPESWDLVEFSQLRESLRYGTSNRCTVTRATYPVLRIPNIMSARIDASDLKYCDLPEEEAARYELQEGDLIFIRTNGVIERLGLCAVFRGEPARALFASYLIRARLKEGINSDYVAYFFGSPVGTQLIASRATPAADGKFNLNTGIIDSLPVPLPTLDEQVEIAALLKTIDHKLELQRTKLELLKELFERMLHDLMTGAIAVDDLVFPPGPLPERNAA
ncbi:restriction endonuclease subunit S [Streptomyces griseorubiginosus]|uniref:restriction endonuclease subunit S n=1 Tax=Streptomyces griseorubiginosus TaxID=67304 RepID=UPI001140071A|nr:restriction endonuclease subunit S [Streptomyces griseorubiginosus]